MRAKKAEWPVAVRDRWEAFYQEILRHFGEIAYVIEDDFPTRTVRLRQDAARLWDETERASDA